MKPLEYLKNRFTGINNTYWFAVFIILAVAAAMRLTGLNFSYSNDELSALLRVRYDSFGDLVDKGFYVDGHPGGIQVFLYYWVGLFGMNEIVVRLPFALGGVLAVYFAIRLFTRWFGPSAGLLTGAFLAFLEFPLLYSQIARPYGSGLLFSMMATWYWTRLLFDEKPLKRYALAYALTSAACMYNHYFSFLLALIIGLTGLFYLKRDRILHYLAAGTIAALLFIPHIYITLNHLGIGGVGQWLAKPESGWILSHIYYIFNESLVMLMIAGIAAGMLFFLSGKTARFSKFHLFVLLFFLLPFLTGYFYSRLVNPVLQHSVLIFSFPFLIALLFSFAGNISTKQISMLAIIILFAGTFQTIAGNRYFSRQHFGEFRGIANAIAGWDKQIGQEKITRAISINNPWYLDFYLDRMQGGRTTFVQYDNRGGVQLDSLAMILNGCNTDYFMYAWTKPVPVEIRDMILARYPCIADEVDFSGLATASLFERSLADCLNKTRDTLFNIPGNPSVEMMEDFIQLDSLEYSPGFEGNASPFLQKTGTRLVARVEALTAEQKSAAILVMSFHSDKEETLHWAGARFDLFCIPGQWSVVRQTILLSDPKLIKSKIKVYVWNKNREKMRIRKFTLTTEEPITHKAD